MDALLSTLPLTHLPTGRGGGASVGAGEVGGILWGGAILGIFGAGGGALIGMAVGNTKKGAIIGGGVGALTGIWIVSALSNLG